MLASVIQSAAPAGFPAIEFSLAQTLQSPVALVFGQVSRWLPVWLTPLWVLAIGLVAGLVVTVGFYAILALLSFVPGLGNLADSPRRGVIASLLVGGGIAAALCANYIPLAPDYSGSLYIPLITVGLICGFGLVYGVWSRTRREWLDIVGEGVIPYLLWTLGLFAAFGLVGSVFVDNPQEILDSVQSVNVFSNGVETTSVRVPGSVVDNPDDATFHAANLDYDLRSISELSITTDKTVILADSDKLSEFRRTPTRLNADESLSYRYADREDPPVPADSSRLHIQNREIDDAVVTFTFTTAPRVPEAASIVWTAVMFFLLITGLMAFRQAAPRVWAMALSTAKNEMAQPLYVLLLGIGLFGVLVFAVYPFNTLGDDIRLLKDSGVTLIMVLGMLQAVWSAGTSVSEEIDGRTALTVLSKPVSRRSFLLGKYAGIMLAVLVLFVIIGAVLLVLIGYKPIYDARETSRAATTWQEGHEEVMTTIPVLGLYFMETMAI
ncbi:MAG: ABC transporter permease, partial [Planctomycetota bacterium]